MAEYLYPRRPRSEVLRPPITLLVILVGENIIFDPSGEEIAAADAVMAISVDDDAGDKGKGLKLLSMRTVDPPSRLTQIGVPNSENLATTAEHVAGVWRPRRGGVKRNVIARMVKMVLGKGGVGEEVMEGLEGVEV